LEKVVVTSQDILYAPPDFKEKLHEAQTTLASQKGMKNG